MYYNSEYTNGTKYYKWGTTNCARLVWDLMLYIILDYDLAVKFTIHTTGLEKWEETLNTIKNKYSEFYNNFKNMYLSIKSNSQLINIGKLLNGQYKLDDAFNVRNENRSETCIVM